MPNFKQIKCVFAVAVAVAAAAAAAVDAAAAAAASASATAAAMFPPSAPVSRYNVQSAIELLCAALFFGEMRI